MSMSHWAKQLAKLLAEKFSYRHELLDVAPHEVADYIQKKLEQLHFEDFVRGLKPSTPGKERRWNSTG
jgi:hypothetical protein